MAARDRVDPRLVDGRGRVALPRAALRALGIGPRGGFVEVEVGPGGAVALHPLVVQRAAGAPEATGRPGSAALSASGARSAPPR